jgi:hypothetical protein
MAPGRLLDAADNGVPAVWHLLLAAVKRLCAGGGRQLIYSNKLQEIAIIPLQ